MKRALQVVSMALIWGSAMLVPRSAAPQGVPQTRPAVVVLQRAIQIQLDSIRINDEDDDLSNDEPYLIVTKVRMRLDPATARIVRGTLVVDNVMSGHNNLGRGGDNWADEVRTYSIPPTVPRMVSEYVPTHQAGWVVAAIIVHMEEDGFSRSTAARLGLAIRDAVRTAMNSMTLSGFDTRTITREVAGKIQRDLARALRHVSIGGIIRGLASAVDPDDFGGINVVVTVTGDNNKLYAYAGLAPDTPADLGSSVSTVREVATSFPFTLQYPTPGVGEGSAKFEGNHQVNGLVRVGLRSPVRVEVRPAR